MPPPTNISADQAAKSLGSLIARVGEGETFILTRYGKGAAQLGPIADPDPRLERAGEVTKRHTRMALGGAEESHTEPGGPGAPDHVQPGRPQSYAERQPKQTAKDALLNAMRTKKPR